MQRKITIALSLLLFCGSISHPANSQVFLSTPLTSSSKSGHEIITSTEGSRTVVDIYSPFGIGKAELSFENGKWQKPLLLRFHLAGLESLSLTIGNLTVSTSVQSHSDYKQCCTTLSIDGKKLSRIEEDDPFWMPIKIVSRKEPSGSLIPLEDGYFEVIIPETLLESNPEKLFIHWIDFYRI